MCPYMSMFSKESRLIPKILWWLQKERSICGPQLLPMKNMGHRLFFFSLSTGASVEQFIIIINVKSLISAPTHYSRSLNTLSLSLQLSHQLNLH